MQQSKTEHISEQEAKEQLEKQAGLTFEYAHAQYNKNLRQWSFAVKNKAGAVVFSAVSFKDFAPYRALAGHLNTSFAEVLDRYVFVYGAQHECGQGKDDERYCLIDKGWLKVSDIEEAFIKKFGQYRKDYEMHDELWVLTIDGSECSSSTYKKHPKQGWAPRSERAVLALGKLESKALQLSFDAFLTPTESSLSTSDKETPPEQPQTAPHSQKPAQPTEPAVSNTDTGKPKKPAKPDGSGTDTGKQKKQDEHKGTAQSEPEKSELIFPDEEEFRAAMLEVDKFIEDIRAGTLEVEVELPEGLTLGEQDDADDLYNIAINYQNGLGGLKQDKTTALECYRKAADKGHADAMNMIGRYYGEGWGGLKKDEAAALEWCRKAADAGSVSAMYNIAVYYQNGLGGLKADKATALEWYRKAADKGDADAMYKIGTYYSKGLGGLKKNEATAIEWFRKAAAQGNSAAKNIINQYDNKGGTILPTVRLQEMREFLSAGKEAINFPLIRLALLASLIWWIMVLWISPIEDRNKAFNYLNNGDKVTALVWFRKAAAKSDADAMCTIGRYYEEGWGGLEEDKAAALEWYRKAAELGDATALYNIAVYYQNGLAGFKADKTIALVWFRKAADKGQADAMNMIGRYYEEGWGGLEEDKATALEWFRKAANMGNATALYNIAVYYQNGLAGFKADKTIALEWFRKAADKGQADAMNMIGRYYDEGWGGLKTDKAAALEWYRKAVDAGAMNEIYDKQGEAPATTLECVPKTAEQNDTNAAEMVKQLEKPTQTDVKIDNHKKVTVYFKKIFRFDRYVDINYIIYMVCLVSGFISIFFDSDTRKGTFVILSAVSITASGLSILYSALVFCAMYI